MKNKSLVILALLHVPDIALLFLLALYLSGSRIIPQYIPHYVIYIFVGFLVVKQIVAFVLYKGLYLNRINKINEIISNFKQGQFTKIRNGKKRGHELLRIIYELSVIGKYVDNTIVTLTDMQGNVIS